MKIEKERVARWEKAVADWLFSEKQLLPSDITVGADAWYIAHRCGIVRECYGDTSRDIPAIPGVHDAHIQTALQAIFPAAKFLDKKVY